MKTPVKRINHRQEFDKFRNIAYKKRNNCVICGKDFNTALIKLPDFPITEVYTRELIKEKLGYVDQEFYYCVNCGHGQLTKVIDPQILYGDNYVTRTSLSCSASTAIDTFLVFVNSILNHRQNLSVIEIGCNDLYALKKLEGRSKILFGIDPIWKNKIVPNNEKIRVIGDFIENVDICKLVKDPDVIICSHTIEHIEDPKGFIQKLVENVSSKTLLFFQFPALEPLVQACRFDQVHNQHLNYFSLESIRHLIEDVNAELVDYRFNHDHWGTLMVAFRKRHRLKDNSLPRLRFLLNDITHREIKDRYKLFCESMNITGRRIASLKDKRRVYGFGAALMLPLLYYYIKEISSLDCIIDDDLGKKGLYYINLPLKISLPCEIKNIKDSTVVITAINSKLVTRAIIERLIQLKVRDIVIPGNLI